MAILSLQNIGKNVNVLHTDKASVLFSYGTPVAAFITGKKNGWYRTKQKYSRTTSKHINKWLLDVVNVTEVSHTELMQLIT